jgi:hypothetical protein
MVLGDHGRKVLHPMTPFQRVALFPYGKLYKHSMYFRAICGVGVAVAAGWIYVIGYKGIDKHFITRYQLNGNIFPCQT